MSRGELTTARGFEAVVGDSNGIRATLRDVRKVAGVETTVVTV